MMEKHIFLGNKTICSEKKNNHVFPDLGRDIMFNIFIRVPARRVLKLRYGCKLWFAIISNASFIDAHLRHSNPGLILIPRCPRPRRVLIGYVYPNIIRIKNENITMHRFRIKHIKCVIDSCNGLVLLQNVPSKGNLSVANPVTNQMHTLHPTQRSGLQIAHGITYIDATGDYKVVAAIIDNTGSLGCEVFVLGSDTWNWVSSPFKSIAVEVVDNDEYSDNDEYISIKGVFHFAVPGHSMVGVTGNFTYMVSFDTVEEKFYRTRSPCIGWPRIIEIDDCPAVVDLQEGFGWDIWVLKDLYKGEWDKRFSVRVGQLYSWIVSSYTTVVATAENGRLLFLARGFPPEIEYFVYDDQLQKLRTMEIDPKMDYYWRPHVESLVPC